MYFNPAALLASALLWGSSLAASYPITSPDPFKTYVISAQNIQATLIPYGATLTSLLVNDRDGKQQDVAVGYDDPKQYLTDTKTNHTYFGCIVGRYANRIKNGSFELDGVKYPITKNENNDTQTLHGGVVGYDQRPWTVVNHTETSITFSLLDTGFEGFPGDVITYATYSVGSSCSKEKTKCGTKLTAKTVSLALTKKTPIMLAHHIYWNLNAFKRPNVLNDTTLHLPLSKQFIYIDSAAIPTGRLADTATTFDGALDFTQPKLIGRDIASAKNCGANCTGYDNAFIIDRPVNESDWTSSPETMAVALNMASSTSGISMQVTTNQKAIQIYSCNNQDGTIPVKKSQVHRNKMEGNKESVDVINQYGCIVIETESWIDGISNPKWGQDNFQIYSLDTGPAVNWVTFAFGNV
ncbi:aldose 1-epimerase [Blastomyces dermatitidis ER-3]|uniref:Aldose 1-epimerase n=2 Tax=Ajellomyces dermatitidis TaxID=5039 RepID=F2T9L4_AJEDA|nr:aldose 1-epimerase [Blastomyces dermatitidis ER-3]EEQ84106.1 aldose 1-epimerase [Blastomyces dermatitidis ER-3]EGE79927.1 aldose 1-epimerase [Blastomyces dermatitidis ATCC 18188]